ncbi:MAG: hypothetical protein KIG61_02620 [Muribaculaceae bacterium]|nr:hypothetical protein [Muribaculaceae bacterium]
MKKSRILILTIIILMGMMTFYSCGGGEKRQEVAVNDQPLAPWELLEEGETPAIRDLDSDTGTFEESIYPDGSEVVDTLSTQTAAEDSLVVGMSSESRQRYARIGKLREFFNDSNKYQYAAGERIGIKPIRGVADAYFTRRPLVRVTTGEWYAIDNLTHSLPYLVPEARRLLDEIGKNFTDSIRKRKGASAKIIVTSLLRTSHSVKSLRRVNRNATDSSTHQLGTTFDITYSKFATYGNGTRLSNEEMKYILAEVLRDLRQQNKCMVKYEVHSPCFHITATGR